MRKVFYKDSFRVLIRLTDCAGHTVAPPSCDWSARIYTPGSTRFVSIGYSAGERRGWTPEGDAIAVAVDNHGLRPGPLLADFQFCLPSDAMPDGCQELQRSYDLELRLSERQECCMPSAAEATLLLPFIKGEKGEQGEKGDRGEKGDTGEQGVQGEKGEQGEVSAAQLEEVHSELRREIVGLWDETAAIQAKLADLYSTECANLLRRLGYEQEDIDEFIWATAHLNLPIGMDDIRYSVNVWENKFEGDSAAKVAPKWTQELEDSEWTPATLIEKYFRTAVYFPHLTTAKGWWNARASARYYAGMHALAEVDILARLNVQATDCYTGLGSFTGKISSFRIEYGAPCLRYLKCLKSDIPISLYQAAFKTYYLTDLSGVCLDNATNMGCFASTTSTPFGQPAFYNIPTKLPKKALPDDKSLSMLNAFGGRAFSGEVFDLRGRNWSTIANIFASYVLYPQIAVRYNSCVFDNCEILLDSEESNKYPLAYLGYMDVPKNAKSRVSLPGCKNLNPSVLVSYQLEEPTECGVWEVDCPDVERLDSKYCNTRTCCTFWNLGSSLKYDVPLKYMMRSCQAGYFAGGMYNNPVLRESFRASLRTWKEPPFAAKILLYSEQYEALTEEDVADITEKGYTLVVSDDKGDYPGSFRGF